MDLFDFSVPPPNSKPEMKYLIYLNKFKTPCFNFELDVLKFKKAMEPFIAEMNLPNTQQLVELLASRGGATSLSHQSYDIVVWWCVMFEWTSYVELIWRRYNMGYMRFADVVATTVPPTLQPRWLSSVLCETTYAQWIYTIREEQVGTLLANPKLDPLIFHFQRILNSDKMLVPPTIKYIDYTKKWVSDTLKKTTSAATTQLFVEIRAAACPGEPVNINRLQPNSGALCRGHRIEFNFCHECFAKWWFGYNWKLSTKQGETILQFKDTPFFESAQKLMELLMDDDESFLPRLTKDQDFYQLWKRWEILTKSLAIFRKHQMGSARFLEVFDLMAKVTKGVESLGLLGRLKDKKPTITTKPPHTMGMSHATAHNTIAVYVLKASVATPFTDEDTQIAYLLSTSVPQHEGLMVNALGKAIDDPMMPGIPVIINFLMQVVLDANTQGVRTTDFAQMVKLFSIIVTRDGTKFSDEKRILYAQTIAWLMHWSTLNNGLGVPTVVLSAFTRLTTPTAADDPGLFKTFTDLMNNAIENVFNQYKDRVIDYVNVGAQMVSLGISLFNIVWATLQPEVPKVLLSLNIVQLVCAVYGTWRAFDVALRHEDFAALKEQIWNLFVDGMKEDEKNKKITTFKGLTSLTVSQKTKTKVGRTAWEQLVFTKNIGRKPAGVQMIPQSSSSSSKYTSSEDPGPEPAHYRPLNRMVSAGIMQAQGDAANLPLPESETDTGGLPPLIQNAHTTPIGAWTRDQAAAVQLPDSAPENNSSFEDLGETPTATKIPQILVKLVSVIAVAGCAWGGYKAPANVLKDVGMGLKAADTTVAGVNELLSEVFGVDVDGSKAEMILLTELEKAGQEFLDMPSPRWAESAVKTEVDLWLVNANAMLKKPQPQRINTTRLASLCFEVSKRVADMSRIRTTSRTRPVPSAIWLYGSPGHGKTEMLHTYVIPYLSEMFSTSPDVFNMDSGKYSMPILNQRWAVYDEAGAKADTNDGIMDRLNNLLSGAPCVMPGAEVENKNQVATFNAVFFLSNMLPNQVDFKLTPASTNALLSRLRVYKVHDPAFDNTQPRDNQPHRQADFTHLRISAMTVNGTQKRDAAGQPITYTPFELVDDIASDVIFKSTRFATTTGQTLVDPNLVQQFHANLPQGFKLPNPYGEGATAGTPFTLSLCGKQGSRKTTQWCLELVSIFQTMGFQRKDVDKLHICQEMYPKRQEEERIIWVIDDQFDLTSGVECQDLLRFLNTIPTEDAVLFISNYGPKSWGSTFRDPGYVPVALKNHPGLLRRLAFDKQRPESRCYIATPVKLTNFHTGAAFTAVDLVNSYLSYVNGSEFVTLHDKMPDILPFSAGEADFWMTLDKHCPFDSFDQLRQNAQISMRLIPIIMKNAGGLYGTRDWYSNLRRMFLNGMLKDMKDCKVYVRVPGKAFMYYNGAFYQQEGISDFIMAYDDEKDRAYLVSDVYPGGRFIIDRTHYSSLLMFDRPISEDRDDVTVFLQLAASRNAKDENWAKIEASRYYKLSQTEVSFLSNKVAQGKMAAWFDIVKKHWQIPAFIAGLCVLTPIVVKMCSTAAPTVQISPPGENCDFCSRGLICPTIFKTQEMIENDEVVVTAKGKTGKLNKASVRLKNPTKFQFNNKMFVVSGADNDFGDNYVVERMYHDFHRRVQAGRLEEKDDHWYIDIPISSGKAYAKLPKSGGVWTLYHDDDPVQATAGINVGEFMKNIWKASDSRGRTFTLTIISNLVAVTSAHCVNSLGEVCESWNQKGDRHDFIVVSIDRKRELAFLVPCNGTTKDVTPLPGISSLQAAIVSRASIPATGSATFVAPRGGGFSIFGGNYHIQSVPYPVLTEKELINWKEDAGLISWGSAVCPVYEGDSGAPIFISTPQGVRLIGIQAAKRTYSCQMLFAVLSQENFSAIPTTGTVQAPEPEPIVKQTDLEVTSLPASNAGVSVYIPGAFARHINKCTTPPMYLKNHAWHLGRVWNRLPVDTSNDRIAIGSKSMEAIFGNLKSPALPVLEVELDHADKIPPDDHGLRSALHIKMKKLSESHEVDPDVADLANKAAIRLAEWYKMQYGVTSLNPLSMDAAINGTVPDKKLEMDSSTGAAFQIMHPGNPTKHLLFQTEQLEGKPVHKKFSDSPAGIWLAEFATRQWDALKSGVLLTLPASGSFKSELLPNHKLWKKRLVYVVDTATVLNQKRILQPIMDVLTSNGPLSDFQLALNPYTEFDAIARKLQRISTNGILSLDFKDFDLGIPGELLVAAGYFVAEWYHPRAVNLRRAALALVAGIGSTPILVGTHLYGKDRGMLSGVYGTSLLDSIVVKIMLYVVVSKLLEADELIPVDQFFGIVDSIGCGDDTTLAIAPEVQPVLHFTSLGASLLKEFNMVITGDAKDGSDVPFTTITEASFCSRRFVRLDNHPTCLISQLKPESMSGALCWSAFKEPTDIYQQLLALRAEFVGWGKERFLQFEAALRAYSKHAKTEYQPILWDDLVEEAWRANMAASSPLHIRTDLLEVDVPPKFSLKDIDFRQIAKNLLGFPDPMAQQLTGVSHKNKLKIVRNAFQKAETLEEFRTSEPARWLRQNPQPQVTVQCKHGTLSFNWTTPDTLGWYAKLAAGRSIDESAELVKILQYKTPEGSPAPSRHAQFEARQDVAEALLDAERTPTCPRAWRKLSRMSSVVPTADAAQSRAPATAANRKPVSTTGTGAGPGIAAVSIPPTVVQADASAAPPSVDTTGLGPPVLVSAPGIDGRNADQTGYFRDLVSYLWEPYPTEQLTVTTSTSQGTVIQSWDFDPWNPNLVGPMVSQYADAHDTFVGSLLLTFKVTEVPFTSGRLGFFWVPGPYVDTVTPNVMELSRFTGYVHDIKSIMGMGSGYTVVLSPGSTSKFVVQRKDLELQSFGRLYMIAYTAIQTSYPNTLEIPINVMACLAPGASFSNPLPKKGSTLGGILDLPTKGSTLTIDGVHGLPVSSKSIAIQGFKQVNATKILAYPEGTVNLGDQSKAVTVKLVKGGVGHTSNGETFFGKSAGKAPPNNDYGDISFENHDTTIFVTDNWCEIEGFKGYATTAMGFYADADFGITAGRHIGLNSSQGASGSARTNPQVIKKVYERSEDGKYLILGEDLAPPYRETWNTDVKFLNAPVDLMGKVVHFPGTPWYVDITEGTALASRGMTGFRDGVPTGYKRFEITPDTDDLPLVQVGVVGATVFANGTSFASKVEDAHYFEEYPQVKSIISTMRVGGDLVQVLRNAYGWWVFAPNMPDYAVYNSKPDWVQVHEPHGVPWPNLLPIRPAAWKTRVQSTTSTATAALAAGGSIFQGIGSAISAVLDQKNKEADRKLAYYGIDTQAKVAGQQYATQAAVANLQTHGNIFVAALNNKTTAENNARTNLVQTWMQKAQMDFDKSMFWRQTGVQAFGMGAGTRDSPVGKDPLTGRVVGITDYDPETQEDVDRAAAAAATVQTLGLDTARSLDLSDEGGTELEPLGESKA